MNARVIGDVYYLAVKGMCNTNCAFCNFYEQKKSPDIQTHFLDLKGEVDTVYEEGYRDICIGVDGYEPTMFPYFLEILSYIHSKGITISLNSNGVLFANMNFAQNVSQYLSKIYITLYASNDTEHFLYTQKKQSYRVKLKAIKNCLESGISVQASVLLLKTNITNLKSIIESTKIFWSHKNFIKKINLIEPSCQMGMTRNNALVPQYKRMISVLNTLDLNGISKYVKIQLLSAIPKCVLSHIRNTNIHTVFSASFSVGMGFVSSCDTCSYKKQCKGIDTGYIKAFGESEFKNYDTAAIEDEKTEDFIVSALKKAKREIVASSYRK